MNPRQSYIEQLKNEHFDLVVIGGGASGAGCALDAALRGLKVALIEKTDFAAETSSKSTKMVHGGVRYLEQAFKKLDLAQLKQVKHGLHERKLVLQNAPHLAHPLELLTPVFNWWEGLYYFLGLTFYEWFAGKHDSMPRSRWISKTTALKLLPGLNPNIHSAIVYADGQLDDARYCLALVQSAAEAGAVVANHVELLEFHKNDQGKIISATVKDHDVTNQGSVFEIKSTVFLNCCGPQADVIRLQANAALTNRISPSKGVHLILPGRFLAGKTALLIPKTRDGRMAFVIPFEHELLVGTTDEPWLQNAKEPILEYHETRFLLDTLGPFLNQSVDIGEVKAGFGGLRPLVRAGSGRKDKSTKSLLRDHEVEVDEKSGLVSLLGGKWTTYRLMAKDATDIICKLLNRQAPCTTHQHILWGAQGWTEDFWKKLEADFGLDSDVSQHLAEKYGAFAVDVAALAKSETKWKERLAPPLPYLKAEVVYAVRKEMAVEIRDFLARRVRLECTDWEATKMAAPAVAELMAKELGWTSVEKERQLERYLQQIDMFIQEAKIA